MHLYLHVPYCVAKCPYCDFNSIAGRFDEHTAYVEALLQEIRSLPRGPYATIFLGGGTPTLLSAALLGRLLHGLRQHITLTEDYEFTCEANPGTVDAERFAVLAEHGVNRISLGVQSTHDHHLKTLGRVHSSAEADRAIALARATVPRVSADLIVGLTGQTTDELRTDLELYRRHDLQHASVYHLTYEPGTEFYAQLQRGQAKEIDQLQSRELLRMVTTGLEDLGLQRYETSNFSRPQHESRHNLAYWHGRNYQAAGAGAVSTVDGVRITREKHPAKYIAAMTSAGAATWKTETLTATDSLHEAWMLGLRLRSGLPLTRVEALGDQRSRFTPRIAALVGEGLVVLNDDHLQLTEDSWPLLDEIAVYLLP